MTGFLRKRKRICWYDEWYNEAFGFRLVMQDESFFIFMVINYEKSNFYNNYGVCICNVDSDYVERKL